MWLFTVLFVGTGVYSMVRLAALVSGLHAAVDRAAELSHLLMSVAMVAMTWDWSGGPSSRSGILQIVVFSLVGLYFLLGAVRGYLAPLAAAYHLVMALTMLWMVATMPVLMGAGSSSGMAMDGMPGMISGGADPAGVPAGAHTWVLPFSVVLVALLVAAALFWGVRAGRRSAALDGACPAPGEGAGTYPPSASAAVDAAGAVAVAIAPPKHVGSLLSPRADAACHAVMSAGMAGMLAAML
jgi:hypothetical protein